MRVTATLLTRFISTFSFALFLLFTHHTAAQTDNFCGTVMTITPGSSCSPQSGSTAGFSNDSQYSSTCPGNENDEGWYQITGGTPGNSYTVRVQGTGGADMVVSIVGVNNANCNDNLQIGCSDDTGNNGIEEVEFTWTNSFDAYYIQVYNYSSSGGGNFNICVVDEGASSCGGGESDCLGATVLCSNGPVAFNPCGPGANDFPTGNDGCLSGEHQSSWYYFEINDNAPASTQLMFTLTPTDNTDYDFAIFGPNVDCGTSLGAPIRCSYAAGSCGFCPSTGLGMGQTDVSENAGGNGFVAPLTVQPGQGFYMLIDNFDNSSQAFTLTWGGSAAPYLNCTPDCELEATATASPTTVCAGQSSNLTATATGATGAVTYSWSNGGSGMTTSVSPSTTTTYTVTVSDGSCTTTSTVTVMVGNTLTATAVGTQNTACTTPFSGSVNLTTSGTMYTWSNGATTEDLTGVEPGTYTVTVTDSNGCSTSTSATVGNNPMLPTATLTPVNNMACPPVAPNGSITLTTNGVSYIWSSGATGTTLTDLSAGAYTVTVTGSNGCTTVTNATIADTSTPPTASITPSPNTACTPANYDGTLTLNTNGISFVWSNGATSQNLTGVEPGTYTVTVTAANGCTTVTASSVTNNPVLPTASITPSPNTACTPANYDGTLTLNTSGISFVWSNGATSQNLTGVESGTYTVTVTAANGCTTVTSSSVTNNPVLPTASITPTPNTACNPANYDGTLTLNTSGISFVWSNGATSQNLTGVEPGTYTVTVTAANGCTTVTYSSVTNNPVLPTASITPSPNTACTPANYDGTLTLNTSGISFVWSNGATSQNLTGVEPGTYTVTVTAANGCTTVTSSSVTNNPVLPTASITPTPNTACTPANYDGTLTLNTNGISFVWSNGATSQNLTGIAPGTYTVTVTAANGCTTVTSSSIANIPDLPSISLNMTPNTSCNPSLFDGTVNLTTDGVDFDWSNGAATEDLINVYSGAYTVTVTGSNGCTATGSITVSTNVILPTAALSSIPNTGCPPSGENGAISMTTNAASYVWSNGATTTNLSNIPGGTYTVTVTASNGCTNTASINVTNSPLLPTASIFTLPNTACTPALADGALFLTTDGVSVVWSNGSSATTITQLTTGLYSVTVTGANECTVVASATIANIPVLPNVQLNPINNTSCLAGNPNGSISLITDAISYIWNTGSTSQNLTNLPPAPYSVTVTGANGCTSVGLAIIGTDITLPTVSVAVSPNNGCTSGSYTGSATATSTANQYQWSNGTNSASISGVNGGTYTVTVTDNNGCTNTSSATITSSPILPTGSILAAPNTACSPSAYSGSVSLTTNGVAFQWSNGATSEDLSNVGPGAYVVTVTGSNGCTNSFSINVPNAPVLPTAFATNTNNTSCIPGEYNGAINISSDGVGFVWNTGETTSNLSNIGAGTYTVTITGANGCTLSLSRTVGENLPFVSATITTTPNSTCTVGQYDGTVNLTTSAITYLWSNGDTTEDLANVANGVYTVTVTDGNGCTNTASGTVGSQVTLPYANLFPTPNTSCLPSPYNGSVTLQTDASSYLWSNGATGTSLTNLSPGTYTVTVTAATGCTTASSIVVGNSPIVPELMLWPFDNTSCDPLAYNGGAISTSDAVSYIWSNGSTAANLVDVGPGTYAVTVYSTSGCSRTTEVYVGENISTPGAVLTPIPNTGCTPAHYSGGISVVSDGYTFLWSNGATTKNLSNVGAGTYTVLVTDVNGCTAAYSAIVANNLTYPTASITGNTQICAGENVSLTASGGVSYQWSNGGGNAAIANYNNIPGNVTYTVSVTGNNGCTATANIPVTVTAAPQLAILNVTCSSDLSTFNIGVSASNGTLSSSEGSISGSIISNIPTTVTSVDVTVTSTNNAACSITIPVAAPNCNCPSILPPTGPNRSICEGLPLPSLTVTVGAGLQVNWYTTPTGGNPILSNSTAYAPGVSGTWYAEAIDPVTGCVSGTRHAVSLTIHPNPAPAIDGPSAACAGQSVTLTASGGNMYQWSAGGGSNATAEYANLTSNQTYTVTVSNVNNCTATETHTVIVSALPTLQLTDTDCSVDLQSFDINFVANGGDVSTSSGTLSGSTITNIPISVTAVTLTVTNPQNTNCQALLTVNAPNCNCPDIPLPSGANAAICQGETIPTLTAGTLPGLQINWYTVPSGGAPILSNSFTYTPTSAGTYYAQAYDPVTGCISAARAPVTLNINALPIPVISGDANICAQSDATLSASGGTSYAWSSGGGSNNVTTFTGLTNTSTYTVTVTSAQGCTATGTFTVQVSAQPVLVILNTSCAPDLLTYSISFSAAGGQVTTTAGTLVGNTVLNIPITTTSVTLTVTNQQNTSCFVASTINAPNCNCPNIPPPTGGDVELCEGIPITPLSATVPSGLSVNWYTTSSGGIPLQSNTLTYLPLGAGTYFAESYDPATGCTSNQRTPVTLTIHQQPTASVTGPSQACEGDMIQLLATGGGTYFWSNGGGTNADATFTSAVMISSYQVTVTNTHGCTDVASHPIAVAAVPTIAIETVICAPDLLTFNIQVNASGGVITSSAGTVTGNTISGIPADIPIVTVSVTSTANTACSVSIPVTAPNCNCPNIPAPTGNDVSACQGATIPALVASTGIGLQINWYTDPNGGIPVATNSTTYQPTGSGIWYAEAFDPATNCISQQRTPIQATIHPSASATLTGTDSLCAGGSVQLNATGGISYQWSSGTASSATVQFNNVASSATYTVTVTDLHGCTDSATHFAAVIPMPSLQIGATSCSEDLSVWSVTFVSTGDITTSTAGQIVGNTVLNIPIGTGSITLTTVSSLLDECFIIAVISAPQCACPDVPAPVGTNASICPGQNPTALSASAQPGLQVNWYNTASGGTPILSNSNTYIPSGTGIWYAGATDPVNGCSSDVRTPVTLGLHPVPQAAVSGPTMVCAGQEATLSATGGVQYIWADGSTGSTATYDQISAPTTFTVTVSNTFGCTDSEIFTVGIAQLNVITASTNPLCPGDQTGTISLVSVSGATGEYSSQVNGNVFTGNVVTNLAPGNYDLSIEDDLGCRFDTVINIIAPAAWNINLAASPAVILIGQSTQLTLNTNLPPAQVMGIAWDPDATLSCNDCLNPTATPNISTQYSATIEDVNGCLRSTTVNVTVNQEDHIVFPNVIQFGADGSNAFFFPSADLLQYPEVEELRIFDRWGDLVFINRRFAPNNPSSGWDGTVEGKPLDPAVFVYVAIVRRSDGQKLILHGDVTLVK